MRITKFIKRFSVTFIITISLFIGLAYASMFGEENALLSKMLLEDIQQTFHLKDIIGFAKNELKVVNQKYGYEKWINKGLDTVKDYGFLKHIKTDDYVLGTLQYDLGELGVFVDDDDYQLKNIDEWVDQIWMKSPEIVNVETKYPGSLSDWEFQSKKNLPGTFYGSSTMRNMVNRKSAVLSYKQAMWNLKFNEKVRLRLEDLFVDSQSSNPGEASRIAAQATTLQNIQLAKINGTQSGILRLMAEKRLNKLEDDDIDFLNKQRSFIGIKKLMTSVPTFGK
jgi:hypothetical protein